MNEKECGRNLPCPNLGYWPRFFYRKTGKIMKILRIVAILVDFESDSTRDKSEALPFEPTCTAVTMKITAFLDVTLCSLIVWKPEGGGSKFLRNIDQLLPDYTTSYPGREYTLLAPAFMFARSQGDIHYFS
jgi:hypothetical protein